LEWPYKHTRAGGVSNKHNTPNEEKPEQSREKKPRRNVNCTQSRNDNKCTKTVSDNEQNMNGENHVKACQKDNKSNRR